MKYNDKIFHKLCDHYDNYKERLVESQEVLEYFLLIVQNTKKMFPKPETKKLIDELEMKIN